MRENESYLADLQVSNYAISFINDETHRIKEASPLFDNSDMNSDRYPLKR